MASEVINNPLNSTTPDAVDYAKLNKGNATPPPDDPFPPIHVTAEGGK